MTSPSSSPPSPPAKKHRKAIGKEDLNKLEKEKEKENVPPSQFIAAFHQTLGTHSIASRLLSSRDHDYHDYDGCDGTDDDDDDEDEDDFECGTQFGNLIKLCSSPTEFRETHDKMECPLCGIDISQWTQDSRLSHANACLDNEDIRIPCVDDPQNPQQAPPDVAPVLQWLRTLGLSKYDSAFIHHEIDWDSLLSLTHEDLIAIGVAALGPRKKIMQGLKDLRERDNNSIDPGNGSSEHKIDVTKKPAMNRRITDYFPCPLSSAKKNTTSSKQDQLGKAPSVSRRRQAPVKNAVNGRKRDVPAWCSIPGTPFRVDAFRYLRSDCSYWFLTHFHIDHYQGLTRSFSYGKIYCSMITARLVNAKIGIPWEKLYVMPLNQKINIGGVDVTCFDANHCPGAIIILFEPQNSKAVLHTGDFRFNEEMATTSALQECCIHTLILDTTYCNPQYNFPKQEIVLQFVIEAIQAESFNPKTLFLIGSYTIGKERLFLEVARVLHKKIYVTAAKLRLLECLELPPEDMQWLTTKEHESHIHVVPMWTVASFKRLKQLSHQYAERFSLIVAFSPTGWTFGKGRKSSGRRWQQGTIIRYEVPYSEHCSFEELKEFVKFVSPDNIIPSVNNDGETSTDAMMTLLLS